MVILVHYGDCSHTIRCLESLTKNNKYHHGVVIVDHGPNLTSADFWKQFHPNVICIQNYSNPGFGAGCNLGAETALLHGATSLWFLNNDATMDEPILEKLVEFSSQFPDVALWGTYKIDGAKQIGANTFEKWFTDASSKTGNKESKLAQPLHTSVRLLESREGLSGASIFLTKPAWEKIGPWPEKFFLFCEDKAWCMRAHQLGLPIAITDLKILHVGSAATTRHSPMCAFYGTRNQLLLHHETAPCAWLQRLFMKIYILQKCFFRRRLKLLKPTWNAIIAASKLKYGKDIRY